MYQTNEPINFSSNTASSNKKIPRKIFPAIAIGIAAGFLLALGLFAWLMHSFFFGPAPTIYEDAKDYGKCWEKPIHSGLLLFPDKINSAATDTEFYYYWRDTFNFPIAQIHLSCTYEPEDYAQEITRLQSVRKQIGTHMGQVYFDSCQDFSYPAYVAVSGNNIWEYALILEESRTIHYIFTEYCSSEDVHFDKSYLPRNFDDHSRLSFGKEFSIYEYPVYENGEITAVEGDYNREATVPQEEGHYVDAGRYSLQVATEIDANGKETIQGCTLFYLNGETEKTWEYSDLNGKIYLDISLNKDRSQAIITWEEDGETGQSIFDMEQHTFIFV